MSSSDSSVAALEAGGDPLSAHEVLCEELCALRDADDIAAAREAGSLPSGDPRLDPPATPAQLHAIVHNLATPLSALSLSGGGIRSASFALGVLQGLAKCGVLPKFDYLSTVSGGGYIGGWLTALRYHHGDDSAFAMLAAPSVEKAAGEPPAGDDDPHAEAAPYQDLRAHSSFLTPKLGLTSADTWTGIALYLRNLLLNWIVHLPLFLAVLLLPISAQHGTRWLYFQGNQIAPLATALLAVAMLCLLLGLIGALDHRPRYRVQWDETAQSNFRIAAGGFYQGRFLWRVLLPIYFGGVALSAYAAIPGPIAADEIPLLSLIMAADRPLTGWLAVLVFGVAGAILFGGLACVIHFRRGVVQPPRTGGGLEWKDILATASSGIIAGGVIALGIYGYAAINPHEEDVPLLVTLGSSWLMGTIATADMIYVALRSYAASGDADREWLGRTAGWFGAIALAWAVLSAIALYGPPLLDYLDRPDVGSSLVSYLLSAVGGVSGLVAILLGKSDKTSGSSAQAASEPWWGTYVTPAATLLFFAWLLTELARVAHWLVDTLAQGALDALGAPDRLGALGALARRILGFLDALPGTSCQDGTTAASCFLNLDFFGLLVALMLMAVFGALSYSASFFVNVNRFSLNGVYRVRLARAFLGSARAGAAADRRAPDPFTDFDIEDNPRMWRLWDAARQDPPRVMQRRLFHVVNLALNLVGGKNLALQERKAESFVVTPLACGAGETGYRPAAGYGGAYGISLGTAITASGAAQSPNQGHSSSPLTAFLLMLFNVRLGCWLGNPRRERWDQEGPRWGFMVYLAEMFGRTTADHPYIYLSDGGHFENLAVYEMIRRRCRFIVASDAGCDPEHKYQDLGALIRQVRIDFGVTIELGPAFAACKSRGERAVIGVDDKARHCAIARIRYPESGVEGVLVYIKATLTGDEPADVASYAICNDTFPHQSTLNQFYGESQMESYRALGQHVVETIAATGKAKLKSAIQAGTVHSACALRLRHRGNPVATFAAFAWAYAEL
jgi:hypothetical protein